MAGHDEPRERDDLVEPLFAGLSGAGRARDPDDPAGEGARAPLTPEPAADDRWHHTARARAQAEHHVALDREPSTFGLAIKALLLILGLIAAGVFVYLTFGV